MIFHLHFHILPRFEGVALRPPGLDGGSGEDQKPRGEDPRGVGGLSPERPADASYFAQAPDAILWLLSKWRYRAHGLELEGRPSAASGISPMARICMTAPFRSAAACARSNGASEGFGLSAALQLYGRAADRQTAPANISLDAAAEVWGVLYRITRREMLRLDASEGVPSASATVPTGSRWRTPTAPLVASDDLYREGLRGRPPPVLALSDAAARRRARPWAARFLGGPAESVAPAE